MVKEELYQRIQSAIISSTKEPKYVTLSSVKLADILETTSAEIERFVEELIQEGRLKKETLPDPPQFDMYMLP